MRPHLDAIDPDAVGSYAAKRWMEHAGLFGTAPARAVIAAHVTTLGRFAKTGEGDPRRAHELLVLIVAWLFSRWIDPAPDPFDTLVDAPDDADEDRLALAVVLLAARGRVRLAWYDQIHVSEIAALTGLDQSHLARLARQEKLKRMPGGTKSKQHPPPIEGESARELLREHGVEGI